MRTKILCMVLAAALLGGCTVPATTVLAGEGMPPVGRFHGLERQYSARLGILALDTGTGRAVAYRADERFAHCSTVKALLVGVLLQTYPDAELSRVIHYDRSDLLEYAPITSQHLDTGMSVSDLMAAAIEYSDNTAANLLLTEAGGVAGLQRRLRALGDRTTTVNRDEPGLNDAVPGDVRDTSLPRDLAADLRALVLGTALAPPRRATLRQWLLGNTTGAPYIRAGVPTGWTVGDKTGSGGYGTRNDIAVVWPPTRAPIVIAVESDRGVRDAASNDSLIADATRIALATLRPGGRQ